MTKTTKIEFRTDPAFKQKVHQFCKENNITASYFFTQLAENLFKKRNYRQPKQDRKPKIWHGPIDQMPLYM